MKKLVAGAVAISLGAATVAQAGGVAPVIVEDAPVIIAESPGSSFGGMNAGMVVGALLLIAVIAAIASNDDDNGTTEAEGEGPQV